MSENDGPTDTSPAAHLPSGTAALAGTSQALFQRGDFTLASGQQSSWKIECDALTAEDWRGLAAMLAPLCRPFSRVVGIPRGGIPLANALEGYACDHANRLLVVDDVWTTGGSMQRYIDDYVSPVLYPAQQRAVVFARTPTPPDVVALFTMATEDAR